MSGADPATLNTLKLGFRLGPSMEKSSTPGTQPEKGPEDEHELEMSCQKAETHSLRPKEEKCRQWIYLHCRQ